MGVLLKIVFCALLAKIGNCEQEVDGSCMVDGNQIPGCNQDNADEKKAEILEMKEKLEKEKEEKEKNMTPEEKEAEEKKKYSKLFFTNDYDYIIRKELDAADDVIHNDTKKAIELFGDILKRYPESARAKYALARSKVYFGEQLAAGEEKPNSEQAKKYWNEALVLYIELLKSWEPLTEEQMDDEFDEFKDMKYKLNPRLHFQCVIHGTEICDKNNMNHQGIELIEASFKYTLMLKNPRFHRVLLRYYFLVVDELDEAQLANFEKALDRSIEEFPKDFTAKFYKGVMYKLTDRKKEGNKILRALELADGKDNSEFTHDMTTLCMIYYNQNKQSIARTIYQEASKLHLFLSQHQRPLIYLPDMETKPTWPANVEEKLDNGLTPYTTGLTQLTSNWISMRDEALEAAKNMSSNWVSLPYLVTSPGTIVTSPKEPDSGAWNIYPLYMWGKKKNAPCTLAPNTCSFLKKHFPESIKCPLCHVKFIKLDPKVNIQPHCAPTNDKLRIYVGLSNSDKLKYLIEGGSPKEGEEVTMIDGKLKVVDESYAHSLINTSEDLPVFLLAIDIKHPNLPVKWLAGETKKEGLDLAETAKPQFVMY